MKLPWISRELYESIQDHWRDVLTQEREVGADVQRRFDALLEKYHDLRLQGAAPVVPDLAVRQPLSTDLADEEAAIDEAAKPVEVGPFRDDD